MNAEIRQGGNRYLRHKIPRDNAARPESVQLSSGSTEATNNQPERWVDSARAANGLPKNKSKKEVSEILSLPVLRMLIALVTNGSVKAMKVTMITPSKRK